MRLPTPLKPATRLSCFSLSPRSHHFYNQTDKNNPTHPHHHQGDSLYTTTDAAAETINLKTATKPPPTEVVNDDLRFVANDQEVLTQKMKELISKLQSNLPDGESHIYGEIAQELGVNDQTSDKTDLFAILPQAANEQ